MEISKAKELVKEKLPDKRYQHSLRVADTAVKLAEIYDGDIKKLSWQVYYMITVNTKP